ncbi:hypothetical protein RND71_007220 [Anisodus tanguticus]|uniref:Uncharacterized protein n=1 Tax=Anisodus tanguticus TaxID=243964 RepID=A0AAE1SLH9_9SOLA|nr:hypothetical protein RND71_007220 [Anisodus tanguticus]
MDENPYGQFFKQLKDHSTFQNLQLRIAANATLDQRVYNSPSIDQVAAIWIDGNNANILFEREIVVHEHSGNRHRVKHYYGCYDPLQYPMLFPKGEGGWHQGIRKHRNAYEQTAHRSHTTRGNQNPTFTSADQIFAHEDQGNVFLLRKEIIP